ncbi:hypothetical protein EW026_g5496 [Hermanssonia centrifuga]|uniref:Uncharacterized protein n=1 Tax=Hermanssonia centrifuga TaxID=98765 RepID=A0A4S4KF04_9APHY|nr:hypothetical protein EW026_g5496 [Hermanssonia centrifuga]
MKELDAQVESLVLKPWPRIQLIRMTYMNPLEYQPDRDSSPLLTTYHLLALAHIHYSTATLLDARPDLQELMDAVESDQQPEQRLGYGQLQSIFDIVIALPFTIKQGVLKNAVIFRVADMVCRIPAFIQFKDVLSCALTVYDTLKDIDDVIVRATEVGYQIDIMESRYAATVDALHRTLKQYCRADMQRNRLRDKYSVWLMTNTISPNLGIEFLDIAKARGLMQNIVDYSERPGTEYPKCRQVALAILESLVIFDAAAAAAKPREDFAPPVIADSVDSLDIGKLNIG